MSHKSELISLLTDILLRKAPQLAGRVVDLRRLDFSMKELAEIRTILIAEFASSGLLPDFEPSPLGLKIEELISVFNSPFLATKTATPGGSG